MVGWLQPLSTLANIPRGFLSQLYPAATFIDAGSLSSKVSLDAFSGVFDGASDLGGLLGDGIGYGDDFYHQIFFLSFVWIGSAPLPLPFPFVRNKPHLQSFVGRSSLLSSAQLFINYIYINPVHPVHM